MDKHLRAQYGDNWQDCGATCALHVLAAHGGKILARSEPAAGDTFMVELPVGGQGADAAMPQDRLQRLCVDEISRPA